MARCTLLDLPRCGAYARSTGNPCLQAAMPSGKCYFHGGASKLKHGRYSNQAQRKRKETRSQIKELRNQLNEMKEFVNG